MFISEGAKFISIKVRYRRSTEEFPSSSIHPKPFSAWGLNTNLICIAVVKNSYDIKHRSSIT